MFLLRYIILPPVIALLVNLLFGRWWGKRTTAGLACGSVFLSFLVALRDVHYLFDITLPEMRVATDRVFSWIAVGRVEVPIQLVLDPLSGVMCLIITGVGFLIHLYSVGYMAHDPGFRRFFIYLNLFIAFMLVLVLADSLALLFVGWEGVGLCSYLLIGFWHADMKNAAAGKKAFIVNRVGDFGFLIGMLILWSAIGTLSVSGMRQAIADAAAAGTLTPIGPLTVTVACLCLFVGACGKSAQIPLYTWLPDAMAGPTPVSALIHAATMVTAGVYMIARLHFLYTLAPLASGVVSAVGAATAVYAAVIGIAQNDIKKVLAYSTISQLGVMFLAVGVGAYAFGIFHLTTHAFFKALLFLGSGSVIHALSGEQDIRRMGGLVRSLPITFATFLVGTLAIAGVYPLSGFFSKDEILLAARLSETTLLSGQTLFLVSLAAAFLTAFYMGRLLVLTFFGESRGAEDRKHHVHESPWTMTLPLVLLAALAAGAGFAHHAFAHALAPLFGEMPEPPAGVEHTVMLTSLAVALSGLAVSCIFYVWVPALPKKISESMRLLHGLVANKFYVDELYDHTAVRLVYLAGVVSHAFDKHVVDRAVNWTGGGLKACGFLVSFFQTGNVGTYAIWFLVGVSILMGVMSHG